MRFAIFALACGSLLAAAAFQGGSSAEKKLLLLDWSHQTPASGGDQLAVMIELGVKEKDSVDWSGSFEVTGAKVLNSIPLGFRGKDQWQPPNSWQAGTHRLERWFGGAGDTPVRTVGVVVQLELTDFAQAELKVNTPRGAATLKLAELRQSPCVPALDGQLMFQRVSQTSPIAANPTEEDFPAAAVGPDGALHVAYVAYTLSEPIRREPLATVKAEPENFDAYAAPVAGDQVFLKTRREGKWTEALAVTPGREDVCRVAVACDKNGTVWVAYSAQRQKNFDLFVRPFSNGQFGPEQRLTTDAGPDIDPVMTTDAAGQIAVAWQAFRQGLAGICVRRLSAQGWGDEVKLSDDAGNCWHPSLAAGPQGELAAVWDQYRDGDYDVVSSIAGADGKWSPAQVLAGSPRFEAKPSAVYDGKGRLWVAYEDGPELWGKDYGPFDMGKGKGLYHGHQTKVICWHDNKLQQPEASLPMSEPNEENRRLDGPQYSHPQLGLDGSGQLWLSYRHVYGTRYHTAVGPYWLSYVRRLEGSAWSEPLLLHRSDGLLDSRVVLLPHASLDLLAIHTGDSRQFNPDQLGHDIYASRIALPKTQIAAPVLQPLTLAAKNPAQDDAEMEAVAAIRSYRVEAGGKKRMLLRGEFHRHTEISWDGRPDGSLNDMFRYGLDAAAFDWIGNGDHDHGGGREYPWWLTQKLTDAYHSPGVFMPMFTYERSNGYPHGHRNAMFAQRGIRTLPRLNEGGKLSEGDTKMFYRYLKQFDGICASHTSATGMGTDWRDNDPVVEPIVEIYQGDRNSYEYPGAPRSGNEQNSLGGWKPKGFVNLALQQGIKLGFQSSSDHWSTHISYCIAVADEASRQGILNALKQRHCYGATDNIILDVRAVDDRYMMGDSFDIDQPPKLSVYVRGTAKLAQVDILRDSEVVATLKSDGPELRTTWTDPAPPTHGEHYYYVRVLQTDDEIAWGSPMWINFKPAK